MKLLPVLLIAVSLKASEPVEIPSKAQFAKMTCEQVADWYSPFAWHCPLFVRPDFVAIQIWSETYRACLCSRAGRMPKAKRVAIPSHGKDRVETEEYLTANGTD